MKPTRLSGTLRDATAARIAQLVEFGFSDPQIGQELGGIHANVVCRIRKERGIRSQWINLAWDNRLGTCPHCTDVCELSKLGRVGPHPELLTWPGALPKLGGPCPGSGEFAANLPDLLRKTKATAPITEFVRT